MSSFITCVPPINVPAAPANAYFHTSGPRRPRKSATIPWLPGGKNSVKFRNASSVPVLSPIHVDANPTASSIVGKNARNTLYAIACVIMLHLGNIRPATRHTRVVNSPPPSQLFQFSTLLPELLLSPASDRSARTRIRAPATLPPKVVVAETFCLSWPLPDESAKCIHSIREDRSLRTPEYLSG